MGIEKMNRSVSKVVIGLYLKKIFNLLNKKD